MKSMFVWLPGTSEIYHIANTEWKVCGLINGRNNQNSHTQRRLPAERGYIHSQPCHYEAIKPASPDI